MEVTDKQLLDNYKLGWNDSADNKVPMRFANKLMQTAYTNGYMDFVVGDDVKSVDLQTEEEILISIKGIHNRDGNVL